MSNPPEMTRDDQDRIGLLAGTAFSPGSSIKEKDVFAGRRSQIRQAVDAINQEGRSILIYGERGVGKTSLANVIDAFFLSIANARVFAPHIACDADDTFESIWQKIFGERDRERPTAGLSDSLNDEIDLVLNTGEMTPHTVRAVADLVTSTHLLIPIIDEFDRVQDERTIALFTDTIKSLSDHARNTTVILVGVGDTVDDLIAEHASIERALEQILMPRMSASESSEILRHGASVTGINFSNEAETLIVSIAQGLPHYTHTLGLNASRAAVDDASWVVQETHVEQATSQAIDSTKQSLARAYHSATSSPRPENLFRQVLLACALAHTDPLGYFAAADVRDPMSRIMGEACKIDRFQQHLNRFSSDEVNVLQRIGSPRRYRFRFSNPLLQPYVVMSGLRDGLIGKEDVRGIAGKGPGR